jgi:hypothetical protein
MRTFIKVVWVHVWSTIFCSSLNAIVGGEMLGQNIHGMTECKSEKEDEVIEERGISGVKEHRGYDAALRGLVE